MHPTRRDILGYAACGAGAWALDLAGATRLDAEAPERVLVVLQLSGGNDGLNTVVPFEDAEYRRARGRLALPAKDLRKIGDGFGLHPSLDGLEQMHKKGRLAIVHGVGYPKPNRSHFESMDIWHSADPTRKDMQFGWLGRALDATQSRPELAVNIGQRAPLALNGRRYKPISFANVATYRQVGTKEVTESFRRIAEKGRKSGASVLDRIRRTADDAVRTSREMRARAQVYRSPTRYPGTPLARSLRTVAALTAGGSATRVYYVHHGGYDTHTNQGPRHANLLRQLDDALTAFQRDLERQGLDERVSTFVFTEFGRRVKVNGSGGTDHGVAGPAFCIGSRVRGGFHGEHPDLRDLVQGDLKHSVDFRTVYASLLEDWLAMPSKVALRGDFEALKLFA